MRIAIADDHVDVRHFLQCVLGQAEYSSSQFTNGRDLITALQRETFDLLIVDWNMLLQSGIEAVFWTRANLVPCLPIIVITSRSDNVDVVTALEAGADDHIVKPEAPSVILARVRPALRRSTPQLERQGRSAGTAAIYVRQRGAYLGIKTLDCESTSTSELLVYSTAIRPR